MGSKLAFRTVCAVPLRQSRMVPFSNRTPNNWLNAGAYAQPASPWQLGNAPQRMTQLRERAARNVDMSVAKNFGVSGFRRGSALNS